MNKCYICSMELRRANIVALENAVYTLCDACSDMLGFTSHAIEIAKEAEING